MAEPNVVPWLNLQSWDVPWTVGVVPDSDSPNLWVKTNRIRTCVTIPSTLVYLWESAPTESHLFMFSLPQVSSKLRFRWLCQRHRWGRMQEDRGWVRRKNVFVMHLFISETNTSKVTSKEQLLYHCRLSNFVREGRQNWIEPSIWNNRNWSFDFWYLKAASRQSEQWKQQVLTFWRRGIQQRFNKAFARSTKSPIQRCHTQLVPCRLCTSFLLFLHHPPLVGRSWHAGMRVFSVLKCWPERPAWILVHLPYSPGRTLVYVDEPDRNS